jgi:protein phosphatase 1 regulatory subunit 21
MSTSPSNAENSDTFSNHSTNLNDNDSINGHLMTNSTSQSNLSSALFNDSSKYERFVQDYVKLKSKLKILKKAYIEQSEQSTAKDQSIRKYEHEIESLNFRNQQLTSRVESLQRELDSSKSTTYSPPTASHSNSTSNVANFDHKTSVLAEELQLKINENSSLHRRLNELEVEFRQKLAKTEQTLKQCEYEKLDLEKKIDALEQKTKHELEKLQNEKSALELNIIQLENQLRTTHSEKEQKETENQELMFIQQQLRANSSTTSLVSTEEKSNANASKSETKTPIDEHFLLSHFQEISSALSKLYASLDERYSCKLASKCEHLLNQQLVANVRNKNVKTAKEFDTLLTQYFESNRELVHFIANQLKASSQDVDKKLRVYLNKLDGLLFADTDLNLITSMRHLIQSILFAKSYENFNLLTSSMLEKFVADLSTLSDCLDKMIFLFNEKVSFEHSNNYENSLIALDECLLAYLTQLKISVHQLIGLIQKESQMGHLIAKLTAFSPLIQSSSPQTPNEPVNTQSSFADQTMLIDELKLNLSEKEKEFGELKKCYGELISNYENDEKQLRELKSKIEQMTSEYEQLVQRENEQKELIKQLQLEKQQILRKLEVFTEQAGNLSSEHPNANKIESDHKVNNESSSKQEKQLIFSNIPSDLFEKQIEMLNSRIQHLDSKSYFYYEEMLSLEERLRYQLGINQQKEYEIGEIRDQLERTRAGYETQMSTMSDHLIELTERMAKQAEENEKLKFDLNNLANNGKINAKTSLNNRKSK